MSFPTVHQKNNTAAAPQVSTPASATDSKGNQTAAQEQTTTVFTAAEQVLIEQLAKDKTLLGAKLVEANKNNDPRLKQICQTALKKIPYTPTEKAAIQMIGASTPLFAPMASALSHANNEAEAEEAMINYYAKKPDIEDFYHFCLTQPNYDAKKLALMQKAVARSKHL
jgi:hypothetical protein